MDTRYFFLSFAAVVLAACTRLENPVEDKVPVSLTYSTVAATETKAAQDLNEGTFDSGENITVRIRNTGAGEWTDYTFTTGAAGAMTAPNPGPYYPAGTQNIDIAAYYPATAGTSFTVASDQTADDDYKVSDLMFASVTNQAKQAEAVNLEFSHKMAKLNVNITAGTGVSSINSLSVLNVKPTVSFDQATGEVGEATGNATTIAMSNNGAAVIPAQTINGGLLSIVTDKGTATYSVANKEFEAGKLYTINITVNLRAVGAITEITDWTGEGTMTVNPVASDKTPEGVEAIDMGHPDGVKWANRNLGARTEADHGDYFAWGVTYPFYMFYNAYGEVCEHWLVNDTPDDKYAYDWANYPFIQGPDIGNYDEHHITKYTFADLDLDGIWWEYWPGVEHELVNAQFGGDNRDGVEHKDFASYDYEDDAARQNWGGRWRTPTKAEWAWLLENSTWTWAKDYLGDGSNKTGSIVTSTVNGNSIFLPAADHFHGTDYFFPGLQGYYWSSSLSESFSYDASFIFFSHDNENDIVYVMENTDFRCYGLPVRPVID